MNFLVEKTMLFDVWKKKKVRIERDKNRITINNKHKIDRWKEGRNAAAIATDQRNKSKK